MPAIAAAAHARGALVLMDNTWASPLYFRALEKGVDLSIQSGTKYIGGHSDVMLGTVSANEAAWPQLKDMVFTSGLCVGPDDMYLGLRGLRTMGVRLARHQQSGLAVARWLEARPEVLRVVHPALPNHPGHAIWKRDFTGACGLFSIVFKPVPQEAVFAFLNALQPLRHGRILGRLRKPSDSIRLHRCSHCNKVGTGRPNRALPYWARRCGRFDRRSRKRLCRLCRGALIL